MTPEDAAKLRAEFPPSAIGKLPKGGTMLDYVGHAATTDRLLQVDAEWTWEPFAVDAAGLPALSKDGDLWIRLTVAGVTRVGVGDGKNMKERIGDAIRNAAMRFGVALDLWAKEDLHDQTPAPTRKAAAKKAAAPAAAPAPTEDGTATGITDAQLKKIQTMYGLPGVAIRDDATKKATTAALLGLPRLGSHRHLTIEQASRLIEILTAVEAGRLGLVADDQGAVTGTVESSAPAGGDDIPPHPADEDR